MENNGNEKLYRDWILEWLEDKKNYVKESTYASYANIVYNHLIPKIGNYKLKEINNHVIQKYILSLYKNGRVDSGGGLSQKTVRDIITIIKLSLRKALKDKLIDYIDLEFDYPTSSSNLKVKYFDKLEQRKIIIYCLESFTLKDIGILLSLQTGMRIGELCALKWEDINFNKNIIYINKTLQRIYNKETGKTKVVVTNPKTVKANREIPIDKDFAKLLKIFRNGNKNYVLTNTETSMEPRSFRKYYYKIIENTKISKISFHSLRHTYASNCIRLGVDYKTVSELLGHASVNITLNIYVHPQLSEKKRCANLLFKENSDLFLNAYKKNKDVEIKSDIIS